MDFFEKVGETVYNTGKTISDKAKEMAAIAELKGQINTCNTVIKKNYSLIGKTYYANNALNPEPEYMDMVMEIRNAQKKIDELQKQIDAIKEHSSI